MLVGLLELRHTIQEHGHLFLFTVFVLITWLLWLIKLGLSRRYKPWTADYQTTTSVVVPVVDEPLDLFREVLDLILEQHPSEVIVVINGKRNQALEEVCEQVDGVVDWYWTPQAGKRNAVRLGVELARGDVVVLVDSDTIWTPGTLRELVKPFADPTVGGVTTRQRILDAHRGFLTRWADWLENSRALYSMPAQSVLGTVGCLPGRTIAFRRQVLVESMAEFMSKQFLGVFMEVSDDRTLTNLTLQRGYRTVYQSTSLVYTDAPTRLKKMIKQQFRWARGSQYNTLRMLPWMLTHAPLLAIFFLVDIVLPFLWLAAAIAWIIRSVNHQGADLYANMIKDHDRISAIVAVVLLTLFASTLSMALRQLRHLAEKPSDLLRLPLFILFSTLVLMPIRIYGFLRLGHIGSWGTRAGAHTAARADTTAGTAGGAAGGEARVPRSGAVTGSNAVLLQRDTEDRHVVPAAARQDGDPRGLLPYVLALTILVLGVVYDAHL